MNSRARPPVCDRCSLCMTAASVSASYCVPSGYDSASTRFCVVVLRCSTNIVPARTPIGNGPVPVHGDAPTPSQPRYSHSSRSCWDSGERVHLAYCYVGSLVCRRQRVCYSLRVALALDVHDDGEPCADAGSCMIGWRGTIPFGGLHGPIMLRTRAWTRRGTISFGWLHG